MIKPVYLDYNATAPIRSSVMEVMTGVMAEVGNPSSVHAAGRAAKSHIEDARLKVASLVGGRARDVVFTGSGTEANNTVLRSDHIDTLLISAIEHESVQEAAKASGKTVHTIPVTPAGSLDIDALRGTLSRAEGKCLVSVMLVNNETGTIQPVQDAAAVAKEYGALVHTDAVQAAGKISIDMTLLGVDYLTLSAHKIGGPQGVGAIVLQPVAPLSSLIKGGGQELGRRSGTENVAGIAGFGEAAIEAFGLLGQMSEIGTMRDRLEAEIRTISNDAVIIGTEGERIANTACLIMPGVKGETQVMHFDLNGICVSSGSACSSGKVKNSSVLEAMGYDRALATNSLRVSLGYRTTDDEVDAFIDAWKSLYKRTHS